jgi:dihydroflavonol-4-reductase
LTKGTAHFGRLVHHRPSLAAAPLRAIRAVTTLVTGGTGYVGGAVARALLARGEQVRVLARDPGKASALVALGAEVARGDILDRASLDAALVGCDTLYHVAAIYAFWVPDKRQLMATEVEGTRNALEAARAAGVGKVVYTSTCFTIGEPHGEVGDEQTRHRGYFLSAYEEAKCRAEEVALDYARRGLPVVLVNPGGVYGPGGTGPTGQVLVDMLNGRLPLVFPGVACYVYVDDVARGHLLAAERGQPGERYLLVGAMLDFPELAGAVCQLAGVAPPRRGPIAAARAIAALGEAASRVTGRPPLAARDAVRMMAHGSRTDGSKATRELGLRYTSLEEGLPATLAWYWEQGLLKRRPACLA